jgi:hypothetical protein
LETAAEIPPTVIQCQCLFRVSELLSAQTRWRHQCDIRKVVLSCLAVRCNVLMKSTTKPGMPMNSFLDWLQWLSAFDLVPCFP